MDTQYKIPTDSEFLQAAQLIGMNFPVDGEESRPSDAEAAALDLKEFTVKAIKRAVISLQVVDESTKERTLSWFELQQSAGKNRETD